MRWVVVLTACLAGTGCNAKRGAPIGSSGAAPVPSVSVAPPPAAPQASAPTEPDAGAGTPFVGTAGVTDKGSRLDKPAVQDDVRIARHPGFDRAVFQFEGEKLPGYRIEYVDRPVRRCGSGEVVEIAGQGWLSLRFEPAMAHDDKGRATISERDRQRKLSLGVVREAVLTCDFEGQVVWVLGVSSPNRYRVLELSHPARVVVDIKHR